MASKNYRRRRHSNAEWQYCTVCGKRGFPSRRAARQMNRGTGNALRVYLCGSGVYHVTTMRVPEEAS